jgi:hypothetical protein
VSAAELQGLLDNCQASTLTLLVKGQTDAPTRTHLLHELQLLARLTNVCISLAAMCPNVPADAVTEATLLIQSSRSHATLYPQLTHAGGVAVQMLTSIIPRFYRLMLSPGEPSPGVPWCQGRAIGHAWWDECAVFANGDNGDSVFACPVCSCPLGCRIGVCMFVCVCTATSLSLL